MHRLRYSTVKLASFGALVALLGGCQLVVGFDRSRIPDDGGGQMDAGDSGPRDGGPDGGPDAGDGGPPPACGDEVVNGDEECDDGQNGNDADGCTDACTFTCEVAADCSDDIDCNGAEVCTASNTCESGTPLLDGAACDDDGGTHCFMGNCITPMCGNSIVEPTEGCDDGRNGNDADGCTDMCQRTCDEPSDCDDMEPCTGTETCVDNVCVMGTAPADGASCGAGPRVCFMRMCITPMCGNGTVEPGETCDDGNRVDTDACRDTCEPARCGDGVVRAGVEECDDANEITTDACVSCQTAECGDGFVRSGVEECDDMNSISTDACVSCQTAECGDGFVRSGVEQCDDGNMLNTDACLNTCQNATCGDGFVQATVETCDDRNANACGTCSADCTTAQTAAAATGSITTPALDADCADATAAGICDGQTFTISDGVTSVVFELDTESTPSLTNPAHVAVPVFGAANANAVRDAIITAVNASALNITAATGSGSGRVDLANDVASSAGNVPITETVTDPAFAVTGMSGGRARDCAAGTGCNGGNVCLSGTCTSNLCVGP